MLLDSFFDELEKIAVSWKKVDRLESRVRKLRYGTPERNKALLDLQRLKISLRDKERRRKMNTVKEQMYNLFFKDDLLDFGSTPPRNEVRINKRREEFGKDYQQPMFELWGSRYRGSTPATTRTKNVSAANKEVKKMLREGRTLPTSKQLTKMRESAEQEVARLKPVDPTAVLEGKAIAREVDKEKIRAAQRRVLSKRQKGVQKLKTFKDNRATRMGYDEYSRKFFEEFSDRDLDDMRHIVGVDSSDALRIKREMKRRERVARNSRFESEIRSEMESLNRGQRSQNARSFLWR